MTLKINQISEFWSNVYCMLQYYATGLQRIQTCLFWFFYEWKFKLYNFIHKIRSRSFECGCIVLFHISVGCFDFIFIFSLIFRKTSEWRTITLTEKMLFVIATCGFLACVILLIGLGVIVNHHTSCNKTAPGKFRLYYDFLL